MAMFERLAAVLALSLAACVAHAGDIYVCKGQGGVKTYQNTPCSAATDQVGHSQYDNAMSRAPAPAPSYSQQLDQDRYSSGHSQPEDVAAQHYVQPTAPAAESTAGYQCVAGTRRWVQREPCPSTYGTSQTVDVHGVTQYGEFVTGTGTIQQRAPVRQQGLTESQLCDQVSSGARMGTKSSASDAYERNKLKSQLSCH